MLGKTDSGKSSTANTILGRKFFDTKVSGSSVTQRCRRATGEFRGRNLTLLDTPGLLGTQTPQEVQRELRRSVSLLYPGPHVFLIVVQIERFTQEEKEAVRHIKLAMGSHALSFSVVVFTHGDLLEEWKSEKHCLIKGCTALAQLVDGCGGRYCVFNNQSPKTKEQVSELLALVESVLQGNGGSCYSIRMLQKAEDELTRGLQEERRLLNEKLLKMNLVSAIKDSYEKELVVPQQQKKKKMDELRRKHELEKIEKLVRERANGLRWEMEDSDREKKERNLQEMVRMVELCREEEEKRIALQEKLDKLTKMLDKQVEREDKMKRTIEEKIQKDREENEKRESEREVQHIQKEQAIRQREEMKRDALQKQLDKLALSLEEQCRGEENRKKQMEDLLRREREENQREREIQMENLRVEKRRTMALQQELKLLRMKMEQQKRSEEKLKRKAEQNLWREKARCDKDESALRKQSDGRCSVLSDKMIKQSAERQSAVKTVTGYMQEMGLVGLNAALESVGAPCCIQ